MEKKLSFLEVVCVALLVNVIHWHVTSSFTVGPQSSIEPTSPSPIEETTTTGLDVCAGYPCPDNKYCVVNETNNRPECVCINYGPPIYAPVCGSDGQTYDNEYVLKYIACETNTVITVQRHGRCDDTTPTTPTPETPETPTSGLTTPIEDTTPTTGCFRYECPIGKECVPDADNRPTCRCISVCYLTYSPVCGSDYKTYDNDCFMRRAACLANTTITVLANTSCEAFSQGMFPSCIGFKCPIGKQCVPDVNNRPTCRCILVCYLVYRPVCGSDHQTYDNDCDMRTVACLANTTITVSFNGRCEDLTPPVPTGTPTTSTAPTPTPTPKPTETPTTPAPTPTATPKPTETPTTAAVATSSVQSTNSHRRSKCRRRKHGRRNKNKALKIFVDLS